MRWITLSTGETGIDYDFLKCSVCGAPFMESEFNDIVFCPDLGHDKTYEEIDLLRQNHDIDISSDTAVACAACAHRIDEILH